MKDTAVTWLRKSGAADHQRAGVTGHSPRTQLAIEEHYFTPGADDAAAAIDLLEAWMTKEGIAL